MPTGTPTQLPYVVSIIQQLQPRSILDIGIGFGKWGHIFREYTDIVNSFEDVARYRKEGWRVRIDGVEGFEPYVTQMHRFLYDNLYVADVRDLIDKAERYDVIYLGDVIEHIEKDKAVEIIDKCVSLANKAVILSTPLGFTEQADACGNELERHRSGWRPADFVRYPRRVVKTFERSSLLVVLLAADAPFPTLNWRYHKQPMPRHRRLARWLLSRLLGWRLFQRYDRWSRLRIVNPAK